MSQFGAENGQGKHRSPIRRTSPAEMRKDPRVQQPGSGTPLAIKNKTRGHLSSAPYGVLLKHCPLYPLFIFQYSTEKEPTRSHFHLVTALLSLTALKM